MIRFSRLPFVCFATMLLGTLAVQGADEHAAPAPSPTATASTRDDDEKARDAGVIDGEVVGVDYQRAAVSVQTTHGKLDVVVLPTTTIQGHGNAFHTIADLARGVKVRIFASQRARQLFAQIIRLK